MKHLSARLLVIAVLGVVLASSGCVYDNTDLVVTENVCVNFDQTITTGSFSTFVVCDQFKEALLSKLDENNKTLDDVKSIHMVSGTFKTMTVTGKKHDWLITADVSIGRRDDPNAGYTDGPEPFVSFQNQSLQALKGAPTDAQLNADGVDVVNRALEALLNGEDPRLVLVVDNETVTPTPSVSDPMDFKLLTCVKFQAIIEMSDPN
ncbi:MAG TPA: hypothetical protein VFX92_12545 [Candidatus Krumholzibacteria bacterium]|nr:hypothetical protein [Candidatus Krumholzibacteria bacterium]